MRVHLSITGFNAGQPFCGQLRSVLLERGDAFHHPNVRLLQINAYRENICSDCLATWDNTELPTNPMPGPSLHKGKVW